MRKKNKNRNYLVIFASWFLEIPFVLALLGGSIFLVVFFGICIYYDKKDNYKKKYPKDDGKTSSYYSFLQSEARKTEIRGY